MLASKASEVSQNLKRWHMVSFPREEAWPQELRVRLEDLVYPWNTDVFAQLATMVEQLIQAVSIDENIARRTAQGTEEDKSWITAAEQEIAKDVIDTCVARWKDDQLSSAWIYMTTGTIVEMTPLFPWRPAILSPGWMRRLTAR